MNTDLISTIMGAVSAFAMAAFTFVAPPGTPTWMKVLGYVAAGSTALWGFFTNKKP
jgi:hypothetical protein